MSEADHLNVAEMQSILGGQEQDEPEQRCCFEISGKSTSTSKLKSIARNLAVAINSEFLDTTDSGYLDPTNPTGSRYYIATSNNVWTIKGLSTG